MSALREIIAKFGVEFDTAALAKGNASIADGIDKLKSFGAALGATFALGAIKEFVVGLTEEADALAKQASALGMSLGEMQQWNYAAMMQGVSAETLAGALAKLSGGKYDPKALAQLGVAASDATGHMKSGADLLEDVAEALSKVDDPTKRNTLAMGVLGKSYAKLLPLLQDGSKGLVELRKEFDELGGGFTDDFAKQADEFGDNLDRTKTLWKNLTIVVLGSVLPTLLTLSKGMLQVAKPIVDVIKHSEALKAAALGLGLKGLVILSAKIGPLGQAFKVLSGHVLRTVLPFLLLEDALVFLQGGDSLIGRFIENSFGPGTSEKVRAWINSVKAEFLGFIDDIKNRPEKLIDDWHLLLATIDKDMQRTFGAGYTLLKQWFNGGIDTIVLWLRLAEAGLQQIFAVLGVVRDEGITAFQAISGYVQFLSGSVAALKAVFTGLWDDVIKGGAGALGFAQKAADAIGAHELGAKLGGVMSSLASLQSQGASAAGGPGAGPQFATAGAGGSPSGVSTLNAAPVVTVNVPPGTTADLANRVGAAAAGGVGKGLRAAYAALVPGQG